MAIVDSWLPPSREHWELITTLWQFFPLVCCASAMLTCIKLTPVQVTLIQWAIDYYPQGKTSVESRLNIPGRIGWATMEAPGFITLLYIMFTLPQQNGIEKLPPANWLMAVLFVSFAGS